MRGQTVVTGFLATVAAHPRATALRWRAGPGAEDWASLSWQDYADRAARLAGGLKALGLTRGDRVVLMMRNRPEFHLLDIAVLLCGGTPISLYNSSSPDQIGYLAGHCAAAVAVVEDAGFLDRLLAVRSRLPGLSQVVVIEPDADTPADVHRYADLLGADPVDLGAAAGIAQPDDLATVIYTSGTTGAPKGVMTTHANLCWQVESFARIRGRDAAGERAVSFLPMAHVAERMVTHYLHVMTGTEVTTCPDPSLLGGYLLATRPHFVFGPPRVWERLLAGIRAALARDPDRQDAFEAALEVGREVSRLRDAGDDVPVELLSRWEPLDADVLAPVRAMVGLDQGRWIITGAAPTPVEVIEFFRALGVPLSETYGMSENQGSLTWEPFRVRPGTAGRAMPGVELRLADDGEVLARGGNVFAGYLDDPDRTAEALADGWLHTGDIGVLDDEGYLRIVDRKKELIITAGGKNVSPANLEAALKSVPLVGQACVIGDARPFITALLVLDPEAAPAWAAAQAIEGGSLVELAVHPSVRAEVERGVAAVNAGFSRAEQVKTFALLGEEWLPDSGELTPTMKLKRRGIHEKYAEVIEGLYAGAARGRGPHRVPHDARGRPGGGARRCRRDQRAQDLRPAAELAAGPDHRLRRTPGEVPRPRRLRTASRRAPGPGRLAALAGRAAGDAPAPGQGPDRGPGAPRRRQRVRPHRARHQEGAGGLRRP
ncbi:MAG: AMP-dependent synthetase/ligase [Mycobacteriales bacterium]